MTLSVSVIIPTRNRAHLVPRAVASALANTEPGDQVIVVDDGSTDNTEGALAPYRDRIRLLRGPHAGVAVARNLGIKAATGELVAFLDDDDEWMPNKLALQRALFQARPDVVFCFSNFAVRDAAGQVHRRYLVQWHQDARDWEQILAPGIPFSSLSPLPANQGEFAVHIGDMYLPLMLSDYVATFTMVARRPAGGIVHYFPEDLPFYEDCDYFARLARLGSAAYLDCETAWNHGHTGPRLTDTDPDVKMCCRLKFLQRVYGQDTDFLARHGAEYERRLADLHRLRARWLLVRGRTREARDELRRAGAASRSERILAMLPGGLVRCLIGLRRLARTRGTEQA